MRNLISLRNPSLVDACGCMPVARSRKLQILSTWRRDAHMQTFWPSTLRRRAAWLIQTQVSLHGFSPPGGLGVVRHFLYALFGARVTGTIDEIVDCSLVTLWGCSEFAQHHWAVVIAVTQCCSIDSHFSTQRQSVPGFGTEAEGKARGVLVALVRVV